MIIKNFKLHYHLYSHRISLAIFLILLTLHLLLWQKVRDIKPVTEIVPNPPSKMAMDFTSLGDKEFLFRLLSTRLQNSGDVFLGFTALKNYDYKRIYLWLEALDYLNEESNFSPAIASYYYSQTQNKEDNRLIVKFINQHSAKNLNKKWWWIVQSSDIASRIPDIDLAISTAELIANNNFDDAPLWTRTISTMLKAKRNGNHDDCFVFQILKKLLEENESGARPINADEMNFMRQFIKNKLAEFKYKNFDPRNCKYEI